MLMRVTPARTRTTHVPGGPGCVVSVVQNTRKDKSDMDKIREENERRDIESMLSVTSKEEITDWIITLKTIRDDQAVMINRFTEALVHIAKEPLTDDAEAREAKYLEAVRIARDAILENE